MYVMFMLPPPTPNMDWTGHATKFTSSTCLTCRCHVCRHDEAATHYVDMIDQTTLGHRFLKSTFGAVPTAGWQIDPFGHSSTNAGLLSAEVGFQSLWFARIDYQDRDLRTSQKRLQFIWRPSPSLGPDVEVRPSRYFGRAHAPCAVVPTIHVLGSVALQHRGVHTIANDAVWRWWLWVRGFD